MGKAMRDPTIFSDRAFVLLTGLCLAAIVIGLVMVGVFTAGGTQP